jgi:tRNA G18 (ribose-2'-O)-methylase SpoU
MPLVDCPDPDCRHGFEVPADHLWQRCRCPVCGAQAAAIPNRWAPPDAPLAWQPQPAHDRLAVVLEDLRSAYNVGSILRSCDAFAAGPVVMAGITAPVDSRKVAKTALGADRWVATQRVTSAVDAVRTAARSGYTVVALETTERSVPLGARRLAPPLALVIGNEVAGVSSPVLDAAQVHLDIPMAGLKTSLNAAVACGIALFVLTRSSPAQAQPAWPAEA